MREAWLVAGLILGIIVGIVSQSFIPGVIFIFIGIFYKTKVSFPILMLGLGIILTVFRLGLLIDATSYYGKQFNFIIDINQPTNYSSTGTQWRGQVVSPLELKGSYVYFWADEDLGKGQVQLLARLFPPVRYRNPGQQWHYYRRIAAGEIGNLASTDIISFTPQRLTPLDKLRTSYRDNINSSLDPDSASLALAITTGDRSLMETDLRQGIYDVGIGHMMAMSGLHVSIISGIILALLKLLGLSRFAAGLFTLGLVCLYVVFVGPAPSLIRAVLMSAWAMAAYIAGRKGLGKSALLWTCFFMLIYNPLWLADYAFVFSFLATAACIWIGPKMEEKLHFLPGVIKKTASLTLSVQLVALPLTMFLFNGFSLWSPIVNILLIPILPILAVSSFLVGLGGVTGVTSWIASLLLQGTMELIHLFGQFNATFHLGGIYLVLVITACGALVAAFYSKKTSYFFALSGILVFSSLLIVQALTVSVWVLDVGQGDSILIRQGFRWTLVDTGDSHAGERTVVRSLQFLGVRKLDYLIITHPHADHVGGLEVVLENYKVKSLLVNQCFVDSSYNIGVNPRVITGLSYLGRDTLVMPPARRLSSLNDNSLVLSFKSHGTNFLLTGDMEAEAEREFRHLTQHDILKVAHHGSNTSTNHQFLEIVKPQIAIISCGIANRYGMPHEDVLERLEAAEVNIFRTDRDGYVKILVWPWGRFRISTFMGG